MEIPNSRKKQFTQQLITRVTPEFKARIEAIKSASGATEADIFRTALEEFVKKFEAAEKKEKGK